MVPIRTNPFGCIKRTHEKIGIDKYAQEVVRSCEFDGGSNTSRPPVVVISDAERRSILLLPTLRGKEDGI
jgi:hypothetical protein